MDGMQLWCLSIMTCAAVAHASALYSVAAAAIKRTVNANYTSMKRNSQ